MMFLKRIFISLTCALMLSSSLAAKEMPNSALVLTEDLDKAVTEVYGLAEGHELEKNRLKYAIAVYGTQTELPFTESMVMPVLAQHISQLDFLDILDSLSKDENFTEFHRKTFLSIYSRFRKKFSANEGLLNDKDKHQIEDLLKSADTLLNQGRYEDREKSSQEMARLLSQKIFINREETLRIFDDYLKKTEDFLPAESRIRLQSIRLKLASSYGDPSKLIDSDSLNALANELASLPPARGIRGINMFHLHEIEGQNKNPLELPEFQKKGVEQGKPAEVAPLRKRLQDNLVRPYEIQDQKN